MEYWKIPSFGKRYNTIRMLKNKRVESAGQYTLENIVDRISKTNPGLITERIFREILQDVFREDIKRDLMMDVLIKDLGMSKEEFWATEPPAKKTTKITKPVLVTPTVVMKQQGPVTVPTPASAPSKTKPKAESVKPEAPKEAATAGKRKLKITTHIPDYSFIIIFQNGKIDIYEDSEKNAKLKDAVWIPPADLKQGKNLSPRSIEVSVTL